MLTCPWCAVQVVDSPCLAEGEASFALSGTRTAPSCYSRQEHLLKLNCQPGMLRASHCLISVC